MTELPLPPYAVRESARAKHVRLVVTPRDGLVVVVPRRFPRRRIPLIVAGKREWIDRALERVREQREQLEAHRGTVPQRVEMPGIGETWTVEYRATLAAGVRAVGRGRVIHLSGAVADVDASHAALRRFCRARAAAVLPAMLDALSAEHALPYAEVKVRGQKTRWGSCSARGNINLNWTLAFLPPGLIRHVLLHELVHTLQLDHSPRFYALLAAHDPDAHLAARELREAWRHVPAWAAGG